MEQPHKISERQAIGLLFTLVISTGVLIAPRLSLANSERGAWIAVIMATLAGGGLAMITAPLGIFAPELRFTDRLIILLGKKLGKLTSLLFSFFLLISYTLVIREGGELVHASFLPATPLSIILLGLSVVALYGTWLGIESLTRMNSLYLPVLIFSFIALFIGALAHPHWSYLFPPLEKGFSSLISSTVVPLAWLGETILILYMTPDISGYGKQSWKVNFFAVLSAGTILILNTILLQITLGPKLAQHYSFPILQVGRSVFPGENLRGYDALLMSIWVVGVIQKLSLWLYYAVHELAYLFQLQNARTFFVPMVILLQILGQVSLENTKELSYAVGHGWAYLAVGSFQGVLPFFLFLLLLRYKKRNQKEGNE